jgi:DNA-binding response OmpR family regulator
MSRQILVVDDDADALVLMSMILKRRGFEVLKAQGGAQALGILAHNLPDMVVLDVMMPHMDGYEVCRQIKADPRTAHLPVVMLTARAQPANQMEGLRAGASDYIAKPVHPDELIERINTVLEQSVSAPADQVARVISVCGAKGGVGATTLAVNLALAVAAQARTILADFEVGGMAAIHLGLTPMHGLNDLLARDVDDIDSASAEAALTPHPSGLRLLAAADTPVDPARASVILNHLLSVCDVCLFDLGGGLSPGGQVIAGRSNDFVLALDSDRVTLAQASRVVQGLTGANLPMNALKLVWVNRLGTPADIAQAAIHAVMGREPAAMIGPAAEACYRALERGEPLVVSEPDHPASVQLRVLAGSLLPAV